MHSMQPSAEDRPLRFLGKRMKATFHVAGKHIDSFCFPQMCNVSDRLDSIRVDFTGEQIVHGQSPAWAFANARIMNPEKGKDALSAFDSVALAPLRGPIATPHSLASPLNSLLVKHCIQSPWTVGQ